MKWWNQTGIWRIAGLLTPGSKQWHPIHSHNSPISQVNSPVCKWHCAEQQHLQNEKPFQVYFKLSKKKPIFLLFLESAISSLWTQNSFLMGFQHSRTPMAAAGSVFSTHCNLDTVKASEQLCGLGFRQFCTLSAGKKTPTHRHTL